MNTLWHYCKNYKKLLFLTLALAIVNQVFSLLDPQIIRRLIDEYIINFQSYTRQEFMKGIVLGGIGLVVVAFISRAAKTFQDYYVSVMTQKIGMQMYQRAIRHIFDLPYTTFENQQSGQLLQKLQKARSDIQSFISTLIGQIFIAIVGLIFVITYAFIVHWVIGLMFFSLIPVMGVTFYIMSKKIKQAQRVIVEQTALLSGATTESIRNVALIKSLGLVHQEMDRLENSNEGVLKLELMKVKILRTLLFMQGTLINLLRVVIMTVMFIFVYTQAITLGEFMSLFFYSFFVFGPLRQAGEIINRYQDASASHELVEELMQYPKEKRPTQPQPFLKKQNDRLSRITFQNVSFAYDSSTQDVLSDISFQVQSGETIAFVGPSGAGKSSLLKLLYSLYQPHNGSVLINDVALTDIALAKYKKKLGIVSQKAELFAGTIVQNLRFVRPNATNAECMKVLKQASLQDLLQEGKDGLETRIGEGGLKLSGGQKQRLAIARALLRDPDVLIFDEATSALDSLVEREITETIKKVSTEQENRMTILVAHRLSTIMHADRIYVLEKGKIIEQGTHQQLKDQTDGLYAAMWRQQIGSQ